MATLSGLSAPNLHLTSTNRYTAAVQTYTKILLGMIVGAVLGMVLGPTSPIFARDVYEVTDTGRLKLHRPTPTGARTISLPELPGDPVILSIVDGQPIDSTGEQNLRVLFEYDQRQQAKDANGDLARALGGVTVGDQVELVLTPELIDLPSGAHTQWPTPTSRMGRTLLQWIRPAGPLFLRLIQMVIVPLVFASLLVGVASLGDVRKLGRVGVRTLVLYTGTTALAVTIGLICASLIKPGAWIDVDARSMLQMQFGGLSSAKIDAATPPDMIDQLLAIVPKNPVSALASGDMLATIFFALALGTALTMVADTRSGLVVEFFDQIQKAMIVLIDLIMKFAPYGVAALVADVVASSGLGVIQALLAYGATVLLGLLVHVVFVYLPLLRTLAGVGPMRFFRAIRPAQLIAFSTSSSSATLPVTLECAEQGLGVSNSVASFVIPLGATVNMDGTALYQGVAAVFIAQVFDIDLSLGDQLGIVLTATMASIGAAGVPGAGMVTLALALVHAGIPTAGVALILGVDRLLDMFRTSVNVTGDLAVAAVVARSEGETLSPAAVHHGGHSP